MIDSGVRYTHEDLGQNMWRNPSEIPGNGVDDDGNGYIDDVHGINAKTDAFHSGDPNDLVGHGTYVAGILGAVGNNTKGIAGVAWRVRIMACKFLNPFGSTAESIKCIDYAIENGARVINASYGSIQFKQAELDAILAAGNAGIIFVAAAGNLSSDSDQNPFYPAAYDADNIVSVAGTSPSAGLYSLSKWGLVRVDLAAPAGEEPGNTAGVYSTLRDSNAAYGRMAGTSMAAPHVSGAFALMRAQFPNDSYLQLINRVFSTTDPLAALNGKCQTGGRLNLHRALTSISATPANDAFANSFQIDIPQSQNSITASANNIDANKKVGEPNHGGDGGGKSVWWRLTPAATQQITIKTEGSSCDTLLGVYTGSSVASLTKIVDDSVSGGCSWCQVVFTASQGTTYHIAVDGFAGAQGIIKLTVMAQGATSQQTLRFDLGSLQRSGGTFSGQMIGPPNTDVGIERLFETNEWQQVGSITLSSGGTGPFNFSHLGPAAFYRAKTSTQIASCNAVGFFDMTVSAGIQKMVANPFNAVDNRVSALFPSAPHGSYLYKWDDVADAYVSNVSVAGAWVNPNMTLTPGEGAIFQASSGYQRGLVGEIPKGYLVTGVPSGWSIQASMIPMAGPVRSGLGAPIREGDKVLRIVNGSYQSFGYFNALWLDANGVQVPEPVIAIGESIWLHKPTDWQQISSFWP